MIAAAAPPHCGRALDVGCGEGRLARLLADSCEKVVALDVDAEIVAAAKNAAPDDLRVDFVHGDILSKGLEADSFDLVTAVAVLHHLPLRPSLVRLGSLVRPGGVLFIVGLYRLATLGDYGHAMVARPISLGLRWLRGDEDGRAAIRAPQETLSEIRQACEELMPGGQFKRRLFFRYTFHWRKPMDEPGRPFTMS